jgi:hypothetical protein
MNRRRDNRAMGLWHPSKRQHAAQARPLLELDGVSAPDSIRPTCVGGTDAIPSDPGPERHSLLVRLPVEVHLSRRHVTTVTSQPHAANAASAAT